MASRKRRRVKITRCGEAHSTTRKVAPRSSGAGNFLAIRLHASVEGHCLTVTSISFGSTPAIKSKSRSRCRSGMRAKIACVAIKQSFADRRATPAHRKTERLSIASTTGIQQTNRFLVLMVIRLSLTRPRWTHWKLAPRRMKTEGRDMKLGEIFSRGVREISRRFVEIGSPGSWRILAASSSCAL